MRRRLRHGVDVDRLIQALRDLRLADLLIHIPLDLREFLLRLTLRPLLRMTDGVAEPTQY